MTANYNRVVEYNKSVPFFEYLARKDISMIVVSPGLLSDIRFKDDPEFKLFLTEYKKWGFDKLDIPETKRSLFYKIDLLGD